MSSSFDSDRALNARAAHEAVSAYGTMADPNSSSDSNNSIAKDHAIKVDDPSHLDGQTPDNSEDVTSTTAPTKRPGLAPLKARSSRSDAWTRTFSSRARSSRALPTVTRGQSTFSVMSVGSNQLHVGYASASRAYGIMVFLTVVTFMTSVTTGLITTSMPTIGRELDIPAQTQYWPVSVYSLTNGACLIVAGAVADVVGSKKIFLVGNMLLAAFVLGCGLAQTSIQLNLFRAFQGIAVALCLPTSVGIITNNIAPGRRRNLGFACTGLGQPLGFSVGLVLGGVFIDTVSWRPGWYLAAGTLFVCCPVGFFLLPADHLLVSPSWKRLRTQVDWPGALIISAGLALLAYALVQISEDQELIREPSVAATLALSLAMLIAFPFWIHFGNKLGWQVLIPNRFWKRKSFSSICIMVMMSYAVMQILELYCTFFFQNVQKLEAIQSSIRLLPSMIVGAALNLVTGLFIDQVSPRWLVFVSSLLCAPAGALMAIINPSWPYWYAAFPAQILQPVSLPSHCLHTCIHLWSIFACLHADPGGPDHSCQPISCSALASSSSAKSSQKTASLWLGRSSTPCLSLAHL